MFVETARSRELCLYVVYTGEEAAGTRFGFVSPDWSADGSAVTALAAKLPLTLRPLL